MEQVARSAAWMVKLAHHPAETVPGSLTIVIAHCGNGSSLSWHRRRVRWHKRSRK
jgi:hypothetical protein